MKYMKPVFSQSVNKTHVCDETIFATEHLKGLKKKERLWYKTETREMIIGAKLNTKHYTTHEVKRFFTCKILL